MIFLGIKSLKCLAKKFNKINTTLFAIYYVILHTQIYGSSMETSVRFD